GGEVAERLRAAGDEGRPVRFSGAGTKLGWGSPVEAEKLAVEACEIHEHNAGDLTAVVDAGLSLHELQETLGEEGQMLALDPPLGDEARATIGGIVATSDSGPLRHRYGSARDLVVGMTVALSDGTVAQSGGKVIKNVAGYDLSKLFTGSYGTLGAILKLSLRLHPLAPENATAVGRSSDPAALAAAALELSHARIELQSLDALWEDGSGAVLGRFGGTRASAPADDAAETMKRHGLQTEVSADDAEWWGDQREAQRSDSGVVVRVSGVQSQLATVLELARDLDARIVGRAGLGLSWITLPNSDDPVATVDDLRRELAPSPCVVLDAPDPVRASLDVWGPRDAGATLLAERVKERFDTAGICAPGLMGR
ncbi:MAG: FAD-binding oxidoreductase, partial [Actinomycetota bacterium]